MQSLDDPAGDGETNTQAGKFACRGQSLESAEQAIDLQWVETHTVVVYPKDRATLSVGHVDADLWRVDAAAEFECVLQQVEQHDTQQPPVRAHTHVRLDMECEANGWILLQQLTGDLGNQRDDVDV